MAGVFLGEELAGEAALGEGLAGEGAFGEGAIGDELTAGNNGLIGFEQFGQPTRYLSSFRGGSGLPPLPSLEETSSSHLRWMKHHKDFSKEL